MPEQSLAYAWRASSAVSFVECIRRRHRPLPTQRSTPFTFFTGFMKPLHWIGAWYEIETNIHVYEKGYQPVFCPAWGARRELRIGDLFLWVQISFWGIAIPA